MSFGPVSTALVSFTSSAPFATGTIVSSAFAVPTAATATSSSAPDLFDGLVLNLSELRVAMGALEIGLILASVSFGMVVIKALDYFRGKNNDGALVKATVASLVAINTVQMVATAHAAYTSLVIDFSSWIGVTQTEWSVMIQILIMTITASIVQTFFVFRLHATKRPGVGFLTGTLLLFILMQLALAIFCVVLMFSEGYIETVWLEANWAMSMTFGISAGVNITIAGIAYEWIQKPYVLRKYGRTTFMAEVEYWTVKGVFGCALVSLFNAIAVGIMGLNMTWLAGTFVLGNLYTLSMLLTLHSRPDSRPDSRPVIDMGAATAPSLSGSTRRASTATLTSDQGLWDDIVKSQALKASIATSPKYNDKSGYLVGYGTDGNVV